MIRLCLLVLFIFIAHDERKVGLYFREFSSVTSSKHFHWKGNNTVIDYTPVACEESLISGSVNTLHLFPSIHFFTGPLTGRNNKDELNVLSIHHIWYLGLLMATRLYMNILSFQFPVKWIYNPFVWFLRISDSDPYPNISKFSLHVPTKDPDPKLLDLHIKRYLNFKGLYRSSYIHIWEFTYL